MVIVVVVIVVVVIVVVVLVMTMIFMVVVIIFGFEEIADGISHREQGDPLGCNSFKGGEQSLFEEQAVHDDQVRCAHGLAVSQ